MLNTVLSSEGTTPCLALLAVLTTRARSLVLLAGFLVAVRGTQDSTRGDIFMAFARHLAERPHPRR